MKRKTKVVGIRVPHPAPFYAEMQADSTHVLVCEKCNARRYVDERFVRSIEEVGKETGAIVSMPLHRPCGRPMKIAALSSPEAKCGYCGCVIPAHKVVAKSKTHYCCDDHIKRHYKYMNFARERKKRKAT